MLEHLKKAEMDIILNSTHDGMIAVNENGTITLFNKSAERLTGISAENALGKDVTEVIVNTRLPQVLESGISELNRQQELGNIKIITSRVPVKNHLGKIVGAVAVFKDITEMKNLAEELTNLKEIQVLLEAIINSTQDAISVVDENGIGIMINPAYTRLTGLTKEDVINKPASVDIAEGESMHFQVLRTKKPVKGVRMKVGPRRKEVLVDVAPIVVNGVLKGSIGVIHDISEIRKLTDELEKARKRIRHLEAKYTFQEIIGSSEAILGAVEQAKKAALTPATVLLRGESGTGKELFAHAIHNASGRNKGQFIRINCASLSDSLLESELFGYVEGAFTGAKRGGRKGLIEEANGGTIFLDEIGETSLSLQTKLLRVIQEKEIIRVGDSKPVQVDVRIIAATNASLEELMQKGLFREDFYYRLNVVPIFIPPLRHRKEDVPLLADHMLNKYNQEYGRNVEAISGEAQKALSNYDWPGNIRELENVISRAMINMKFTDNIMYLEHLPIFTVQKQHILTNKQEKLDRGYNGETYEELYSLWEKSLLQNVLTVTNGNKTEASKTLGISVRNLYYKLQKHNLAN
ncbi:MAG: sigma-54-dependent Fis family transcriptional regulator [Bacillota bacterium]|nr:sigma-54-dependent Fis family transcriptional regulator [Bacillota bacterium]